MCRNSYGFAKNNHSEVGAHSVLLICAKSAKSEPHAAAIAICFPIIPLENLPSMLQATPCRFTSAIQHQLRCQVVYRFDILTLRSSAQFTDVDPLRTATPF